MKNNEPQPWSPDDEPPADPNDFVEWLIRRFRFHLPPFREPPDPEWLARQRSTWAAWDAAAEALQFGRLHEAIALLEAAIASNVPPTTHHLHRLLLQCYRRILRAAAGRRDHGAVLDVVRIMRRHDDQLAAARGERARQILVSDLTAQLRAARRVGDVATELEAEQGILAWHPMSAAGRRIQERRLADAAG